MKHLFLFDVDSVLVEAKMLIDAGPIFLTRYLAAIVIFSGALVELPEISLVLFQDLEHMVHIFRLLWFTDDAAIIQNQGSYFCFLHNNSICHTL